MVTTTFLIIILVFSVYCFYDRNAMYKYLFHPYSIKRNNEHYRFLTHAFIHSDSMHLFLNVFTLFVFGYDVEQYYYVQIFLTDPYTISVEENEHAIKLAKLAYIGLFTGSIYAASITEYFKYRNNPTYSSLGASGAISAIVFSFIFAAPTRTLSLFVLPLPAWLYGILFLAVSYYLSKRKTGDSETDRINHESHFWGAIFGLGYTFILKPSLFTQFINTILNR